MDSIWAGFPLTYREAEVRSLARWIAAGQSGSVVGLPGCGRSNLLGFLCNRPEALRLHVPQPGAEIVMVPANLHDLPAPDISTFYRLLLRAFYHARGGFDAILQRETERLYRENVEKQDPFVPQSALQELLLLFRQRQIKVVLVLNYFHRFIYGADARVANTLRGLRDNFKGTVCVLAGLPQEVAYLPQAEGLGDVRELLDRNVCWVGAMTDADARDLVTRALSRPPDPEEMRAMLDLAGNFPAILKLVATWWAGLPSPIPPARWLEILKGENNVLYRLEKVWEGLTQEERFALFEVQRADGEAPLQSSDATLQRLAVQGVCERTSGRWRVRGTLLAAFVAAVGPTSRGRIWMDPVTQTIYQGVTPVPDLAPLERRLLDYFIARPRRPHDNEALIAHVWEEKADRMADNDLQQLVYRLRKKIDTTPPQYIVTWQGRPGGYQFYPEGQPRST